MERVSLLSALTVAAPALAPEVESIVLTYSCFCFTKTSIIASNDVVAIKLVKPESDFRGLVPGQLLLKFIKSCTGNQVEFEQRQKKDLWRIKCGPTKLDFSYKRAKEYPFKFPKPDGKGISLELDDNFFNGLSLCSEIVADKGLSTWVGGVIFRFDDHLTLYSTNGTRDEVRSYMVSVVEVKKEREAILPVSFCKAVGRLRKEYPEAQATLYVSDSYATVQFGEEATLFGKLILSDANLMAVTKIREYLSGLPERSAIQEKFREVFARAAAVSDKGSNASVKVVDGKLTIKTVAKTGKVVDSFTLEGGHPDVEVTTVPERVVKQMDICDEFCITDRLIGLSGGTFTKLVANKT